MNARRWNRWWDKEGAEAALAVLVSHWDPIMLGGGDAEIHRYHYGEHLRPLGRLLRGGADGAAVAAYLAGWRFEIGLRDDEWLLDAEREAGAALVAWHHEQTRAR